MRDAMKSDKLDEERDRWVNSLNDGEICRLASSFHHGDPCTIFRPRKRGGFNVCFFIAFESTSERWAVRIPIPVMVPKAVLDEKTEIELATMRYVTAKTTIPIPKVHAYAFSDTGLNGLPFIIMDYIDGQSLKDLGFGANDTWGDIDFGEVQTPAARFVHQQLADVYVQLRQLEFPRIGALGLSSRDVSALACSPEEIRVCHRPLSIEISDQELDGLEPKEVFPPKKTFSTAKEFVDGLLWLANNKLEKERDQDLDEKEPESVLYAAHHFKHFIQHEWLDQSANEGPFVLVHGDMDIVIGNILFDEHYKLVGVLDWEWSRVVPAQLMMPPIWLTAGNLEFVLLTQRSYNEQVAYLRTAIQEREKELGLPPLLSTEWAALETWCHPGIAIGLNYPDYAFLAYGELVFRKTVPRNRRSTEEELRKRLDDEVIPRIRAFIEASEERQAFLQKKLRDQLAFFEAEKEHYGYKTARRITKSHSLMW